VSELLKWNHAITAKIVPEIYHYWLNKRDKLRKPLCRRYWPQTPAVDCNPHLTFRPRDKERYRLRKQQRKNDLESFRKMQQLRREFARAKTLLQLVLEREMLKEVGRPLCVDMQLAKIKIFLMYALHKRRITQNSSRSPSLFTRFTG